MTQLTSTSRLESFLLLPFMNLNLFGDLQMTLQRMVAGWSVITKVNPLLDAARPKGTTVSFLRSWTSLPMTGPAMGPCSNIIMHMRHKQSHLTLIHVDTDVSLTLWSSHARAIAWWWDCLPLLTVVSSNGISTGFRLVHMMVTAHSLPCLFNMCSPLSSTD